VEIWKFLHIVSMFSAVTLLIGGSVFAERLFSTRDAPAIARFHGALKPLETLGIIFIVAGIVFGLVTAIVGPFDLTQTWLIIAYVLVAALFVLGPYESVIYNRIFEAAADGDAAALDAAAADTKRKALVVIDIVLYVAIIFVMVTKPGL